VYGVPKDLDLAFLHNAELIQVCLGLHQLQFHFHPIGSISVQSGWELLDAAGVHIDGRHDGVNRPPFLLHRLLGLRVIGVDVFAPEWFAIRFESREVLRVFDDDPHYESFQIQPGNIIA
jgi:hypothetical protein